MPNSYIVRADSPLQKVDDADRAGVNITAVKNDTQDVYLSAHLKNNHVNTVPAMPSLEELASLLLNGKIDAFAANRQRLMEAAARFPKLRVLSDNYFVAGQAVALAKGDPPDPSRLGRPQSIAGRGTGFRLREGFDRSRGTAGCRMPRSPWGVSEPAADRPQDRSP